MLQLRQDDSFNIDCFPYVSILVLNYNGLGFLAKCFSSLHLTNYPGDKYEVILVDNGSNDNSVEYVKREFPWVKIVRLEQNFGFGGGNNRGVKYAKGEYIAFLNNDTEVTKDWLLKLVQASVATSTPICSSKTLFMKNHSVVDYGGSRFTVNGRGYSIAFGKADDGKTECAFTGYPCAASMLIESKVFRRLGGFDEDYFACLDDTDLGWRAWLRGYKTLFCPDSVVYHVAGGTAGIGRLSPLKAFHGTKDPVINILKNLGRQMLFIGLALAMAYDALEVISLLKSKDWACLKMKFKAYPWLFSNFGNILSKRACIQKTRIVSDQWLFNHQFLSSFGESIREYNRLSKLSI